MEVKKLTKDILSVAFDDLPKEALVHVLLEKFLCYFRYIPDAISGDFDSANLELLAQYKQKVGMIMIWKGYLLVLVC